MPAPAVRKRWVRFQVRADEDSAVYVAGGFNDWNPGKNRLKWKDGVYAVSLLLPKGKYEYKFVINDVWCVDPECPEWTPNNMGSLNSVITVE